MMNIFAAAEAPALSERAVLVAEALRSPDLPMNLLIPPAVRSEAAEHVAQAITAAPDLPVRDALAQLPPRLRHAYTPRAVDVIAGFAERMAGAILEQRETGRRREAERVSWPEQDAVAQLGRLAAALAACEAFVAEARAQVELHAAAPLAGREALHRWATATDAVAAAIDTARRGLA